MCVQACELEFVRRWALIRIVKKFVAMPGVIGDAQEFSHGFPDVDIEHAHLIKKKHL